MVEKLCRETRNVPHIIFCQGDHGEEHGAVEERGDLPADGASEAGDAQAGEGHQRFAGQTVPVGGGERQAQGGDAPATEIDQEHCRAGGPDFREE